MILDTEGKRSDMGVNTKRKRIMLTVDKELYEIIKGLDGFGDKDAEKCLNIIRCYLSEHGFLEGK